MELTSTRDSLPRHYVDATWLPHETLSDSHTLWLVGSVGCAESSGELKQGHRNRWFVMFTNVQIDLGFVMGCLMPMIIAAGAPHNLGLVWRLSLGLGVIPPLSLLYL